MYAVAMADSDQDTMLAKQTNTTAHSEAAATAQPPPQSGTAATPNTNTASLAPLSSLSASQAASAQHQDPTLAAGGLDAASEEHRSTSSDPTHAQPHAPGAVRPASKAESDPQGHSDVSTQSSLESSSSCIASSASPQSEPQPVAVGALSDRLMSVEEGLKAARQYLSSVGRYGCESGAFLTPMYGCAELPQAFCRWESVSYSDSAPFVSIGLPCCL